MMQGYIAVDKTGKLLVPFLTLVLLHSNLILNFSIMVLLGFADRSLVEPMNDIKQKLCILVSRRMIHSPFFTFDAMELGRKRSAIPEYHHSSFPKSKVSTICKSFARQSGNVVWHRPFYQISIGR